MTSVIQSQYKKQELLTQLFNFNLTKYATITNQEKTEQWAYRKDKTTGKVINHSFHGKLN